MAACVDTPRTDTSHLSRDPNKSQADDNFYNYAKFCQPSFSDRVSGLPFTKNHMKTMHTHRYSSGARIGHGILLDHATGVVVGETAVIGNNVSILHNVTLGGTGKISGDRHPKIGDGVLIGAGTCILGNIRIGDGAKIGACSVVLKDVPPRTTAVGNPARLVGGKQNPIKLDKIPSFTMDHTSHIAEWSDYVI
ncbi:hypothetical protein GH714_006874 [Hevea brasiliensis]|uniref:serine O-acetyltransferase n=1 Tax=Hevea brasiliensis TaxID=3981 RepID=A0A6A6M0X9_HEVBR|nr:hypothetical protein GH714_006874 [Hevea brasiliensis]